MNAATALHAAHVQRLDLLGKRFAVRGGTQPDQRFAMLALLCPGRALRIQTGHRSDLLVGQVTERLVTIAPLDAQNGQLAADHAARGAKAMAPGVGVTVCPLGALKTPILRHPDRRTVLDDHGAIDAHGLHQIHCLCARFAGAVNNRDAAILERFDGSQRLVKGVGVMVEQGAIEVGIDRCTAHAATSVNHMRSTARSVASSHTKSARSGSVFNACSVSRW